MSQFKLGYRPALDGLRGCAVLAVMAYHTFLPLTSGGLLGVDIFFVLSGFLITTILLEEAAEVGSISLGRFYQRRALRLLPALVLLLAVAEVISLVAYRGAHLLKIQKIILAALFYAGNIVRMGPLAHTWSLAVEEQFYFLWAPFLWLLLRRFKTNAVLSCALAGVVVVCIDRVVLWDRGVPWERIYSSFDTRLDELLAGCAAACVIRLYPGNKITRRLLTWLMPLAGAVLLALIAFPLSNEAMSFYGWPLVECSAALLILGLVVSEKTWLHAFLEIGGLVWIGRISYGLYLWHAPIFAEVTQLHLSKSVIIMTETTMSFAAATLSYYLVERRFLRLKPRKGTPAGNRVLAAEGGN